MLIASERGLFVGVSATYQLSRASDDGWRREGDDERGVGGTEVKRIEGRGDLKMGNRVCILGVGCAEVIPSIHPVTAMQLCNNIHH